jgi:succinate dehydrogenase / fumarate reductase, cytochrome b subunit
LNPQGAVIVATTASPAASVSLKPGVAPLRSGQGTSFLLRRLHSLTGIIPVGAFLFEHILISNATAISGPDAYARQVSFLANLPLVFFLELFGIWLPILFHGLYGFYIWYRGDGNSVQYPWTGNWMYTLQRWTGGIAFIYIVWHTYTMRFTGVDLHEAAAQSFAKVQAEVHNPLLFAFYAVGLIAASWHFAYGIWLFSAKWGIVSGEHAQQRLLRVCLAFFLLLSVVGLVSLYTFRTRFQQTNSEGNIVKLTNLGPSVAERPVN